MNSGFFRLGFDIYVYEFGEMRLKFGDYEIWSFKVEYGIFVFGYVFKEKDRRGKFLKEKLREYGFEEGLIFGKFEREGKIEWNGRIIWFEDVIGLRRKGLKIVYIGDMEFCERVKFFFERVDLFIYEVIYLNFGDRGDSYYLIVEEVCDIVRRVKVKLFVLFYRVFCYSYEDYVEEVFKICESFGVRVVVLRDFDVIIFKLGMWEFRNFLEERE